MARPGFIKRWLFVSFILWAFGCHQWRDFGLAFLLSIDFRGQWNDSDTAKLIAFRLFCVWLPSLFAGMDWDVRWKIWPLPSLACLAVTFPLEWAVLRVQRQCVG
jgi:hypothetical protein